MESFPYLSQTWKFAELKIVIHYHWFSFCTFFELFLFTKFVTSVTTISIFIIIFDFVQGNVLHGYVFAMKLSLEDLSLAALPQLRDQIWLEITFYSQRTDFQTWLHNLSTFLFWLSASSQSSQPEHENEEQGNFPHPPLISLLKKFQPWLNWSIET